MRFPGSALLIFTLFLNSGTAVGFSSEAGHVLLLPLELIFRYSASSGPSGFARPCAALNVRDDAWEPPPENCPPISGHEEGLESQSPREANATPASAEQPAGEAFDARLEEEVTDERAAPPDRGKFAPQVREIVADVPSDVAVARPNTGAARVAAETVRPGHELRQAGIGETPTPVRKGGPSVAVAVFPFARSGLVVSNDADHLLPEFAHQYVADDRRLQLMASYYKTEGSKIRDQSVYWSATNQPLERRIYSDGARIGADWVLMYSYSGSYAMSDRFSVTVYLFDVKHRRAYKASGDQNNYKDVTNQIVRDHIASR